MAFESTSKTSIKNRLLCLAPTLALKLDYVPIDAQCCKIVDSTLTLMPGLTMAVLSSWSIVPPCNNRSRYSVYSINALMYIQAYRQLTTFVMIYVADKTE